MTIMAAWFILFFAFLILVLLRASIEDMKTHKVSHKTQAFIIVFALPLIALNLDALTLIHAGYVALVFILYKLGMGGADVKTLVPLSLTLPLIPLAVFTVLFNVFGIIHAVITKNYKGIPMLLPITLAFVFAKALGVLNI